MPCLNLRRHLGDHMAKAQCLTILRHLIYHFTISRTRTKMHLRVHVETQICVPVSPGRPICLMQWLRIVRNSVKFKACVGRCS